MPEERKAMRLSHTLPQFSDCWQSTATKAVQFHKVLSPSDSMTLEHLRELSARRDALADKRVFLDGNPDAGEEEHKRKNYVHWVHQYTALYERFIQQSDMLLSEETAKKLQFQWNSPLADQANKFFTLKKLQMERVMVLHLYGAALRQQAYHLTSLPPTSEVEGLGPHAESAALLRRAAGVYTFLSDCVLPSIVDDLPPERPSELTPSAAACLASCALGEAQAVTVHRAMEKGSSPMLVAQLHMGVSQLMEEASQKLREGTAEHNQVSSRLRRYIAVASTLHEALACAQVGQHVLSADGQAGAAVALCDHAGQLLRKCEHASEGDSRWLEVIAEAAASISSARGHFDAERSMVYFQSIPSTIPKMPDAKDVSRLSWAEDKQGIR